MVAPTFSKNMPLTIENRSDEEKSANWKSANWKSANGKSTKQEPIVAGTLETSLVATRKRTGKDILHEESPKTCILCISPKCGNYVEHWIDEFCMECILHTKTLKKEYFNKLQYLKSPNPFGDEPAPFTTRREYEKQSGCAEWIRLIYKRF
jgi:hypothetical protein